MDLTQKQEKINLSKISHFFVIQKVVLILKISIIHDPAIYLLTKIQIHSAPEPYPTARHSDIAKIKILSV